MNEINKKYFFCSWNEFNQEYYNGTLIKREWKSDPIEKIFNNFLKLKYNSNTDKYKIKSKWSLTTKEEEADLLIIILRPSDRVLDHAALKYMVFGIPQKPKKVLYIHLSEMGIQYDGVLDPYIFIINSCHFDEDSLNEWLATSLPINEVPPPLELDKLKSSLLTWGNLEKNKNISELSQLVEDFDKKGLRVARTGTGFKLISDQKMSCSAFYLGLHRIAGYYNFIEHDLNAKIASREDEEWENKQNVVFKKYFIDACYDLYNALNARYSYSNKNYKKIVALLIDDKPEKYLEEICEIFSNYLPFFELWIWNPEKFPKIENEDGKLNFINLNDIENYSSLHGDLLDKNDKFVEVTRYIEQDGKLNYYDTTHKTIFEILGTVRCVIVDILFQDVYGKEVESGFGVIRGLSRICHDFKEKIEKSIIDNRGEDTHAIGWPNPKYYVLSRANESKKIHTAFRNGAEGYASKERLLSLPGLLANSLNSFTESTYNLHRNFRQLYNLSSEMIGLLRSTYIQRIPFDQFDEKQEKAGFIDNPHVKLMAELIGSLPKTDLHVHPGSCMSPEFLVVASLIMLLRHNKKPTNKKNKYSLKKIKDAIKLLSKYLNGDENFALNPECSGGQPVILKFNGLKNGIKENADLIREHLLNEVKAGNENRKCNKPNKEIALSYRNLRSILHKKLGILDHYNLEKVITILENISDTKIFLYGLSNAIILNNKEESIKDESTKYLGICPEDILRLFILWLAGKNKKTKIVIEFYDHQQKYERPFFRIFINEWFRDGIIEEDKWESLSELFYLRHEKLQGISTDEIRNNNWKLALYDNNKGQHLRVNINLDEKSFCEDNLDSAPSDEDNSISWLLCSGTRSANLHEYLEGCEYSGAEHLRHPFLIHLFAQQASHFLVRNGVLYSELRCAVSGYENPEEEFSFADACACLSSAFAGAQKEILSLWSESEKNKKDTWLWESPFSLSTLSGTIEGPIAINRFPCKVSIILTGKRHKSTRILLRETGAGAVWYSRPMSPTINSLDFVTRCMKECRVAGFDLAGQESEHHPRDFRHEYDQVAKLHIPTTVHAGENAPADFVEGAILDLKARRLGHGLSIADDSLLMDRARDERICIELCPVSNFQTNAIHPYGEAGQGREYPLRKFMENGNAVCINTDNPSVSYTNMVKECFQASYAYGEPGLSLWELLRIFRQGYTHSFLTLSERRALLEIADQMLFDIFSREDVLTFLRIYNSYPPKTYQQY